MADNGNTAVGNTTSTTNTTAEGSEIPQIINSCDLCGQDFDSIEEMHTNLCGVCQNFVDEPMLIGCKACGAEYDRTKDGDEMHCGICVLFDHTAPASHYEPVDTTTNAAPGVADAPPPPAAFTFLPPVLLSQNTPLPPPSPPLPPVQPKAKKPMVKCETCARQFRPSEKNTPMDCTWCCNSYAAKGTDLFAKAFMERTKQAEEGWKEYWRKEAEGQ